MIAAAHPSNDAARVAALRSYDILDTPPEQAYDDFTALAAAICGAPIALISLVDSQRQWFKSRIGLDAQQTPRDVAFCAHAIGSNDTLIVTDAAADNRFHDNPLVTGQPNIRFYAGAPLVTSEGHGLGTLCVIDHVPRTLTAEQQRALEALSRQLMSQLELRRAMIALREAAHAKKMFVANVSHELRTPLTSIRGALSLVLEDLPDVDEDARALLSAAHRNADRLLALVNDLLDLERVGSGELVIDKTECDLAQAIDHAVEVVRPMAFAAGVSIAASAPSLSMQADPERLSQVIINLLASAVRFSPRGGVIRLTAAEQAGRVTIAIDDQGPGVPAAYRKAIFEPFKQVEGSAAHKKGGTGLGLAISDAIVRKHDGTIGVGDAPGGGARFTIELPVRS